MDSFEEIEVYVAIADYTAQEKSNISLCTGQHVQVCVCMCVCVCVLCVCVCVCVCVRACVCILTNCYITMTLLYILIRY